MQADLTIEADLNQLLQLVRGSDLDLLVNAAGFGTIGLFAQNDIEKYESSPFAGRCGDSLVLRPSSKYARK